MLLGLRVTKVMTGTGGTASDRGRWSREMGACLFTFKLGCHVGQAGLELFMLLRVILNF